MFKSAGLVRRALELGACGYVTKSADNSELIKALDAVSAGKTYVEKVLDNDLVKLNGVLSSLTAREQSVFLLIQTGRTNMQIARELGISLATIENYICRICDKTGAAGREGILRMEI